VYTDQFALLQPCWDFMQNDVFNTIRYVYVRSKADDMTSLV